MSVPEIVKAKMRMRKAALLYIVNYYFEVEDGAIAVRFPEKGPLSLESRGFPVWGISVIVATASGIFFFVRRRRRMVA